MGLASPQPADEELLESMRLGCDEAWLQFYRRHQARVYRFALRMTGSAALAEEAVQETFLAILNRSARFNGGRGSPASFLLGVARNKVLRLLEAESPYIGLDAREPEGAALSVDPLGHRALWRAMLSLPVPYRAAVVLCELEELDYGEAAAILGCPVGTVRSRLHRARRMLIGILAPAEKEPQCPA